MPENNSDEQKAALEVPPALIAALKRAPRAPVFIPHTMDEAILHAAHRHLTSQRRARFKWSVLIRWSLAFGAAALLVATVPQALRKPGSGPRGISSDLKHNGQVDILDAFALARQLKAGAHPATTWDINGDGVVDERDVAALAARAVSLGKGGRS